MIRRPPRSTQSRSSAASDVYKRQVEHTAHVDLRILDQKCVLFRSYHEGTRTFLQRTRPRKVIGVPVRDKNRLKIKRGIDNSLSLIHISEPTRLGMISYAVFCLKKKKKK